MKNHPRLSRILFSSLLTGLIFSGALHCGSDGSNPAPTPVTHPLSLTVTGIGSGKVTSNVGALNCTKGGGTCKADLDEGTVITLTATADAGFFFNGWLGACHGIAPCTLTMNQAASVQASFVNIAFTSNRDLDPALDAPNSGSELNIWLANSDGGNPHALAGLLTASSSFPTFSPDGNQVVFTSFRNIDGSPTANTNFSTNVWVVNADGSNPHPLAGLDVTGIQTNFSNPRWSPDGNRIVFISTRDINGQPIPLTNAIGSEGNVWMVNADNSNLKILAGLDVADVTSRFPVWSPDGAKIAFDSTRNIDLGPTPNPNSESNIWVVNADGNGLTPLTKITANGGFAELPQWSPDGSQVAFSSNRSLGNDPNGTPETSDNIWKVNADGSNPVHLTADTGSIFNQNVQWSPDGSLITFQSNKDPNNPDPAGPGVSASNIWAVPADGSQAAFPLTALINPVRCFFPYWAPDGSVAIFESDRNLDPSKDDTLPNATRNIWIVNPDGSGELPVTDMTNGTVFNSSAFNFD